MEKREPSYTDNALISETAYALEEAILKLAKLPLKRHSATNGHMFPDVCENRELCPPRHPYTGPASRGAKCGSPATTGEHWLLKEGDPGCTVLPHLCSGTAPKSRGQM